MGKKNKSSRDRITLRDLMDERDRVYKERDLRYTERFLAQEQALEVALDTQKAHDLRSNGLSDRLAEQYKEFIKSSVSKDEYEHRHNELVSKIDGLKEFQANIGGREVIGRIIMLILGMALTAFGIWFRGH